jgi:hypothetical protein
MAEHHHEKFDYHNCWSFVGTIVVDAAIYDIWYDDLASSSREFVAVNPVEGHRYGQSAKKLADKFFDSMEKRYEHPNPFQT